MNPRTHTQVFVVCSQSVHELDHYDYICAKFSDDAVPSVATSHIDPLH